VDCFFGGGNPECPEKTTDLSQVTVLIHVANKSIYDMLVNKASFLISGLPYKFLAFGVDGIKT
jgi:hypothetical protein